MKSILLFLLLFSTINQFVKGQIDLDLIIKNVTENPSENYFPLLEIFKTNPSQLTQGELNQLYYGSKFANPVDSKASFGDNFEKIFSKTKENISKRKAETLLNDAEFIYQKSPMDKVVLKGMINIYNAVKNEDKYQLAIRQLSLLQNTIEQSGDGKSEETAICVINAMDQLSMIVHLEKGSDFNQEVKQLSNKSILWIYSSGNSKIFVKLVGGYY